MSFLMFSVVSGGEIRYPLPVGRTVLGRADSCDIALQDDDVSRVHCMIQRTGDRVELIDRSRNGTRVNGVEIERAPLVDGCLIEIGKLRLRFQSDTPQNLQPTRSVPRPRAHEELISADSVEVAAVFAGLRFSRGPRAGERMLLDRSSFLLGGGEGEIELAGLPPSALRLRVARGRVIVEPSPGVRVTLAGLPMVSPTPALPGEELRLGEHGLVIEQRIQQDRPDGASFGDLVGGSDSMRRIFGILQRIAAHEHTALITGESGTGKELAARAIHNQGRRASGPFVPINCAALPENLVESTLFGHEKGSFTGATQRQDGAFHRAEGGTLFLDEVGELHLDTQAKLLRALESGEVLRVGAGRTESPDVRVLAATNRDLSAMVRQGLFRSDLYFRLSVLMVRMPPLRERADDVPIIAEVLVRRTLPDATLRPSAIASLKAHPWPGNVRELRNVLTRARVLGGPVITADSIAFTTVPSGTIVSRDDSGQVTEQAIIRALERSEGNRSKAARILGVPRSSLLYRMKRLGIS